MSPGHQASPPAVRLPAAIQTVAMRRWPIACMRGLAERYGKTFEMRVVGLPPLVFLANAADISEVFLTDADRLRPGAGAFTLAPLLGAGSMMLADGPRHLLMRGLLAPVFQRRPDSEQRDAITALVGAELARWPVDQPAALYPRIRKLTLAIMVEFLFDGHQDDVLALERCVAEMLSVTPSMLLLEPKLRRLPYWHGKWRRLHRERQLAGEVVARLVGSGASDAVSAQRDILSSLAGRTSRGSRLTDEEIADNVVSLMIAGHETTASVLTWALQYLALNQEVQDRLIDEIDGGCGADYLMATVLETVRHAPVFLFAMPRAVEQPVEIGGRAYASPTLLMPCIYLMHHDPEFYCDPYAFRPERFLGMSPAGVAWAPWGGGRRRCLGQHLAMLEISAVLREFLRVRRIVAVGSKTEATRWRTAILAPRDGGMAVLVRR